MTNSSITKQAFNTPAQSFTTTAPTTSVSDPQVPHTESVRFTYGNWFEAISTVLYAVSRLVLLLWRIIFPSPSIFRFPFSLSSPTPQASKKIFDFPLSTPSVAGLCAVACLSRLIYKFNIRHFSNLLVGIIFHFTLLAFILLLPFSLTPHGFAPTRLPKISLVGMK
jgi:hypothetical protein